VDDEPPYVLNRTELTPVDLPALPEGYSFRSGNGVQDVAALAAVHSASFGTGLTPELYRKVVESPGYAPERELVIRSPEGAYVAFTVIWFDHLNRIGLFEPVGTHKDCRRRGFGRAIIAYGMQQMLVAGMEVATVAHFGDNEAARGLYRACGFTPWHLLDGYTKPIELDENREA
jgi:GNAT superfamily N-acetyltransferase